MANISISQIQTVAENVTDDDLLLISKKSSTDSSYISARISASKFNGISKLRCVTSDVTCYVSPSGNDDNIEKQFQHFGQSDQASYPVYSINAAVEFIHRFRACKHINFLIQMTQGTYTYDRTQMLYHPDTDCSFYVLGNGSIINTSSNWIAGAHACLFFFTRGYWTFDNLKMYCTQNIEGSIQECLQTSVNSDVNVINCQIHNFDYGCSFDNNCWAWLRDVTITEAAIAVDTQRTSTVGLSGTCSFTSTKESTLAQLRLMGTSLVILMKELNLTIRNTNGRGIYITSKSALQYSGGNQVINVKGKYNAFISYKADQTSVINDDISYHKESFDNSQNTAQWTIETLT